MAKAKLPLIILLILLIISSFISLKFYSDSQSYKNQQTSIMNERDKLLEENESLKQEYENLVKDKNEIEKRLDAIKRKFSGIEREAESLRRERDSLVDEKQQLQESVRELTSQLKAAGSSMEQEQKTTTPLPPAGGGDYWADIVQERAQLKVQVEDLRNQLMDTKTEIARLKKENMTLGIRIDEIKQKKAEAEKLLSFQRRTVELMSQDVVKEREMRKGISEELSRIRDDNVNLKQELIMANKENMELQNNYKTALQSKESLERKLSEIETIMDEKRSLLSDLEDRLSDVVQGAQQDSLEDRVVDSSVKSANKVSSSVELPPIVVQPQQKGASSVSLEGEVLAVNKNDNFVIIDIGEEAGVRPGNKFVVQRGDKQVGIIEVIETRKEISAADIKEVSSGIALREGDRVRLQ